MKVLGIPETAIFIVHTHNKATASLKERHILDHCVGGAYIKEILSKQLRFCSSPSELSVHSFPEEFHIAVPGPNIAYT